MDLRQIEYIIAINEEKSISKAADKLFMTQSALNQQLLKLENEIGTKLFERKRSHMEPTQAGKIYLETAYKMVDMKKETYKRIADIANIDKGEISLVSTAEKASELFACVYPYFHAKYPSISFRLIESNIRQMDQIILKKEADFALSMRSEGVGYNDKIDSIDFVKEEIFLVVPKRAILANSIPFTVEGDEKSVDLKAFRNENFVLRDRNTLIRQICDLRFEREGIKPAVLFEANNNKTVLNMVQQQVCLGFLPESYAIDSEDVFFFSLKPKEYWFRNIIYLKGTYLTKAQKYFIELCKAYNQGKLAPWKNQ